MNNWSILDGRSILVEFDQPAAPNQTLPKFTREGLDFAAPQAAQQGWDWLRGGGFFVSTSPQTGLIASLAVQLEPLVISASGQASINANASNVCGCGLTASGASQIVASASASYGDALLASASATISAQSSSVVDAQLSASGILPISASLIGLLSTTLTAQGGQAASQAGLSVLLDDCIAQSNVSAWIQAALFAQCLISISASASTGTMSVMDATNPFWRIRSRSAEFRLSKRTTNFTVDAREEIWRMETRQTVVHEMPRSVVWRK